MATLIRIKRPLASEPAESIVVKSKRQRTEGAAAEEGEDNTLPTSVLKRVATINSKGEGLEREVLEVIGKRRVTVEELRKGYKRPSSRGPNTTREAIKQQVHHTATQSRLRIHALKRGNIEDTESTNDESKETKEDKSKPTVTAEGSDSKPGKESQTEGDTSTLKQQDIKYYDAELPWSTDKDVITCNGVPMEPEKYVYDIYYSPTDVDWTEFVCEVERYEYPASSDGDSPDDEDDENDENNWRNEYPDEEENPFEDEDDYVSRMLEWRNKQHDPDESFDADEYNDSDDFDEDGNLLQYGQTNTLQSLHLHMKRMGVGSDEDEEEEAMAKGSGDSDSDGDDMVS